MKYYGTHGRYPCATPKQVVERMSKGVLISATANGCMLGWGCSKTHATELTETCGSGSFYQWHLNGWLEPSR